MASGFGRKARMAALGWIVAWSTGGAGLPPGEVRAQAPLDVSSKDLAPTLFTAAHPDGAVDVAWRRADRKIVLSTFSGPLWGNAKHVVLETNLPLLGGLARDDDGNRYVAALREETTSPQDWEANYRPDVAHVYRVRAGSDRTELLADVNTAAFSGKWPIRNPVHMASGAAVNSMLVRGPVGLLWTFGHNNGAAADVHQTGALIGVGLDGRVVYGDGGEQHPAYVAAAPDGDGFVAAQIFDQGIGLSTFKREGGKLKWSNFVLVYEIPRANQAEEALQIAGIIPYADHFLLIFSSGKGWLWNFNNAEIGLDGGCAICCQKIARDFDKLPKFDWWNNVRKAQGGYAVNRIAEPAPGKSYVRALASRRLDANTVVVFEQWGGAEAHEGARAFVLDPSGRPTGVEKFYGGLRIQKSTNFLPVAGGSKLGWTNADAAGSRFLLNTLDDDLNLKSYELGKAGGSAPGPAPVPGRILLTAAMLTGKYVRDNPENDYHEGTVELTSAPGAAPTFRWKNKAGVAWNLGLDAEKYELTSGDDNPYAQDLAPADRSFKLAFRKNSDGLPRAEVEGFHFQNEFYRRNAGAAPAPAKPNAAAVAGRYVRDDPENGYHDGVLSAADPNDPAALVWKNKEGVSWGLKLDAGADLLVSGEDNPYFKTLAAGDRDFRLVYVKNADGTASAVVEGFLFNNELYRKAKGAPAPIPAARIRFQDVPGNYARDNPENGYHEGTILQSAGGRPTFVWKNKAGVEWTLTPDLDKNILATGEDCSYFKDDPEHGRAFLLAPAKNADGSPRGGVEGFYFLQEFYRRVK